MPLAIGEGPDQPAAKPQQVRQRGERLTAFVAPERAVHEFAVNLMM